MRDAESRNEERRPVAGWRVNHESLPGSKKPFACRQSMRLRFTSTVFNFQMSVGYPPPCQEDERDNQWHKSPRILDCFPSQPTVHHITSWIIARLSAYTHGEIQSLNNGRFCNAGGEFAYRFVVTDLHNELIGRCGLIFCREFIEFAGFSKSPYDIKSIFLDLLLSSPSDLRTCLIHSQCAETYNSEYFGYDGRNLR